MPIPETYTVQSLTNDVYRAWYHTICNALAATERELKAAIH